MKEELFDLSPEYEAMLNRGIKLSGEDMVFFITGRLNAVRSWRQGESPVTSCLDFGCGLGHTTSRLARLFSDASTTGVDTSKNALEAARLHNGGPRIRYLPVTELDSDPAQYDVCYVNGVFHHIPPPERPSALALIRRKLRPHGRLFLFENNPWNPGARMVMARIPFDRNAVMMSPRQTAGLLRRGGFDIEGVSSYFFFPRPLGVFRRLEPLIGWTRLGAQYLVVGRPTDG